MTKDQFIAWATSPKMQVAERAFLGSSGWGGIQLAKVFHINPVQTGSLVEVIVQATPVLAALAWGLYAMLEAKIVEKAGAILAAKQAGSVIIANDAPAKFQALAVDPAVPGVN